MALPRFVSVSSYHLLYQLELQEKWSTRTLQKHVVTKSWLPFLQQRWKHGHYGERCPLPNREIFSDTVSEGKL